MDGTTLQARVYAGYARSAAHAGTAYAIYRTDNPVDMVSISNLIGEVDCLFASEVKFAIPQKYKMPTRYLYADGRLLAQRDILVGAYGTFFVGDMQPLFPLQAIRCNDTVTVSRPRYVGTTLVLDQIGGGVPAFKMLKKVDQKPAAFGARNASTAIAEWFLHLPVLRSTIQQGDIVTDAVGTKHTLDSIDETEIGIVATIRQADA